jgi:hypothetical protein
MEMFLLFVIAGIIVTYPPPPPPPRPRRLSCTGFKRNKITGDLDPIDPIYFDEE